MGNAIRIGTQCLVASVLLVFALLTAVRHLASEGADLTSSYCACRLLASGRADHVYARDALSYNIVTDPEWLRLGPLYGMPDVKQIHPYVQIPLWAWSLQPFCTRVNFPAFNVTFLFIMSFCLSATIWVVARVWTPRLMHPGWIALVCAGLYSFEAYKYAMVLTQTHVILTLLALLALVFANRGQPVRAGALLALAAAVKITPGFLLLYWLVDRKWRAAGSFAGFSALLAGAGVLATGPALNFTYLHNLADISKIGLVSYNNQSLTAWWMGLHLPASEQKAWHSFAQPAALKWTAALFTLASTLAGGWFDRRAAQTAKASARPLYGAAFAMVGATVFTPIAWTHYYVILIFPLMLLLQAEVETRSRWLLGALLLIGALNFDYQTGDRILQRYELFPVVRAEFYGGLLTMVALAAVSLRSGIRCMLLRLRLAALNRPCLR